MSKILIVKTGTTYPSLKAVKGDFDAWVVKGFGRDNHADTEVVDVAAGYPLPPVTDFAGVIVTGSHAMVTDRAAWSERAAEWLCKTVKSDVPTLGICYGHQLLAYALGGRIGDNPNGLEAGTVVVTPNAFGSQDKLLSGLQGPFKAHMCHRQSVLVLPKGAVPLAATRKEAYAAFSIHQCAWGVQFHPEFDSRIVKAYVLRHSSELTDQNEDVQQALASCMETGCGREIFEKFLSAVNERARPSGSQAHRHLAHAV